MQKLIQLCVMPTTRKNEWDTYLQIDFVIQRIRQYQTGRKTSHEDRMANLTKFEEWMQQNGVNFENLKPEDYGTEYGIGLKAKTDIQKADILLEVPYKMMMTAEKAKHSYLGDFVESKKILSEMPNISLAIYLHCERFNPDSFYKPYIDVLPSEYNTVLYFTPQELEILKGSSAFYHAITQCKSIARQYGIFYNMMHGDKLSADVKKIPQIARDEFTFDAYRWAVSSVSTRLNKVALKQKDDPCSCCHHDEMSNSTFALIPLWDMMNHSLGELSTSCDPEKELCTSYAMEDFKEEEQVTIFYGARDNTAFLIYNGFVAENNRYDKVEIQLGVSPNDKLYAKKVQLLEKLRMKPNGSFLIYSITDNLPIAPDLLAFLRVFHMTEEDLDEWNGRGYFGRDSLREIYLPANRNKDMEQKIWKFLENRVRLLLMAFKCDEDMEKMLIDVNASARSKLAVKLLKESKKVLTSCRDFCENFSSHPEEYIPHVADTFVTEAANDDGMDNNVGIDNDNGMDSSRADSEGGEKLPQSVDELTLQTLSDLQVTECGDHDHNHENSCPSSHTEAQTEHAIITGGSIDSGVA